MESKCSCQRWCKFEWAGPVALEWAVRPLAAGAPPRQFQQRRSQSLVLSSSGSWRNQFWGLMRVPSLARLASAAVGCVPNPSIERKSNSWLRQPLASAHVQLYALCAISTYNRLTDRPRTRRGRAGPYVEA
jgi:hypothetical protein